MQRSGRHSANYVVSAYPCHMNTVRIGCVKYLNTLPLIEGLRTWEASGGCQLMMSAPSGLIGMLERGEVDVALASVVDAAGPHGHIAHSEQSKGVVLLPVGMIGSDGPTMTVRVFSTRPFEEVEEVAVDSDSHTSVALLRVIMWRRYGKRVRVRTFEVERGSVGRREEEVALSAAEDRGTSPKGEEGGFEAMLLIGDKVVTDAPDGALYPHVMDLGAARKELTGLPFVYAVWMCRAGEEESMAVRAAAAMLDRSRRHNATRLDWIVEMRAEEKGWEKDAAAEYLGRSLKYAVGEAEREAVEKFVRWGSEIGVCGGRVVWSGASQVA